MTEVLRAAYPSLDGATAVSYPFPVPAVVTLKAAGEMGASGRAFTPARAEYLDRAGVSRNRFISLQQVHSRIVHAVDADSYGLDGDGMVTTDRKLVLGVTVADCMPMFLYDRAGGSFGIVHSGWRGTGIISDAIRLMIRHFESDPGELTVMMGPCIGPCCYRVDQDRASLFASRWGEQSVVRRDDGWYLDLPRANLDVLRTIGVSRVIDAQVCTSCNEAFSSYRRDGSDDYTGMMALTGKFTVPDGAVRATVGGMEQEYDQHEK